MYRAGQFPVSCQRLEGRDLFSLHFIQTLGDYEND